VDAHTGALVIRKKMVEKIQMIGCAFLPIDKEKKKILISKRSMNKNTFQAFGK
jgi:molybdate-binding protein